MRAKHLLPAIILCAACGTDVAGPSASLFSCLLADPVLLDPGEVVHAAGAGNRGLCLDGGASGAEFVYIPFHATRPRTDPEDPVRLEVDLSGAGFVTVTGPPTPAPAVAAPSSIAGRAAMPGDAAAPPILADAAFHQRLRAQERGQLGRMVRSGPTLRSPRDRADVPTVGDLVEYNVSISCTTEDIRTGRVEYVSDRAVVVADIDNPVVFGFTAFDYGHFGETFDTLVDPVAVQHFGEPTDIDDNGRAIIFFTRAVNQLNSGSGSSITVGFFWSGDLFPEEETPRAEACPAANQAEMFYMIAPDSLGEHGPGIGPGRLRNMAIPIIGHEYQHLINASRRLWVNDASEFEEPWLNEGLSHMAEELLFYAATGFAPRTNIGYDELTAATGARAAFNTYMGGNFSNYADYLARPDTASLMGLDGLPTRGATWSFLRYAADRSARPDDAFFFDLVNARSAGLANLDGVIAASTLTWMRDWTVSVYADDAVHVDAHYTQPSWDFRDLYPNSTLNHFPLDVISITTGAVRLRLLPGGAAFPRFGIAAGAAGVMHVETEGSAPPSSLRGSVLRTR